MCLNRPEPISQNCAVVTVSTCTHTIRVSHRGGFKQQDLAQSPYKEGKKSWVRVGLNAYLHCRPFLTTLDSLLTHEANGHTKTLQCTDLGGIVGITPSLPDM